jgi:acetylornithine/N-succinyldiaminopimelate aminotransferase
VKADLATAPLMHTYQRAQVEFVAGRGCMLYDSAGNEYLDCLGGIACVAAGHGNEQIAAAVYEQMSRLTHVSNLFWTAPMTELARRLHDTCGFGKVFFANSGAEANECAIKLVRKWAGPGRSTIVCAQGSFHGRTLGALAATGQPAKWAGFEPLPAGFVHVPFNDIDAFAAAVDETTAAIMIEPIQGENGVVPATGAFLSGLRELADDTGCALVFDEVQTGVGRTGAWWAFQTYGIAPDVFTSAKALGNGLPVAACVAADHLSGAFGPGDHATTFGGGPVVCAAALATLDVLAGVLDTVADKSARLREGLRAVPHVREVRGAGLLLAAVLDAERAGEVTDAALELGLVVNAVLADTVRFAPPLVITPAEIDDALHIFCAAVEDVYGGAAA